METMRAHKFLFVVVLTMFSTIVFAQPKWTFDLIGNQEKPPMYEDRLLASEKTANKKFTYWRHFVQNSITHYNYYYNANVIINRVIENAKENQNDDYTKLLSFYPYKFENTASQSNDLDSVLFKCATAILIHDLRTDWVDNMYLLLGKAYFFKKDFDSAALTFQFINYNLFPRKKDEEDSRIIGENQNAQSKIMSIADSEKKKWYKKITKLPPSRNDALIWMIRSFIEQDKQGEAAGMINILQLDPNLPERLHDELLEVKSYWYFKQNIYDSAAFYLEKGMKSFDYKNDRARQKFLLAQLYEITGDFNKASFFYQEAAKETIDPLLDIYANLNNAKMLRTRGDTVELAKCVVKLSSMAKRDKYETYRDIIYHSAGELCMKKPDTTNAVIFFKKSLEFNENNSLFKSKSHLVLGAITYSQKKYQDAAIHYDSVDIALLSAEDDSTQISNRKNTLQKLASQSLIIQTEDSLQKIALLDPDLRDAFLKKLSKKLRKVEDVKNGKKNNKSGGIIIDNKKETSLDLFADNTKGEWYFYNNSLKSRGFSEFINRWGQRDNADNWRRKSATSFSGISNLDAPGDISTLSIDSSLGKPIENSYDALLSNLPITEEAKTESNKKISQALLSASQLLELELLDFMESIVYYQEHLKRYPDSLENGKIYLGLYHCYDKLGNFTLAAYYKNLLINQFPLSVYARMLSNPADLQPWKNNPAFESQYEKVYNFFVQEQFDSALVLKENMECEFGDHYWSPQMLYMWAIYSIKCDNVDYALDMLYDITNNYPNSTITERAQTLIIALKSKTQIEEYLTKLNLDSLNIKPKKVSNKKRDNKVVSNNAKTKENINPKVSPDNLKGTYQWDTTTTKFVVMVLDQVDGVYINEAKNAFTRFNKQYNFSTISITRDNIDNKKALLIFNGFINTDAAILFYDKIKKAASNEVSWLTASQYSFIVIDDSNLQLLKSSKDINGYKSLLKKIYPSKF